MIDERLLKFNEEWIQTKTDLRELATVLLCMRDIPERGAIVREMGERGVKLTAVRTGAEAIERLEAAPWDVLVVAEDLPDLPGMDVVRYVRGRPVSIEIMLLADDPTPRKVLQAIELGVSDYLLDPEQRPSEVVERIKRRLAWSVESRLQQRVLQDLRGLETEGSREMTRLVGLLEDELDAERQRLGPMNHVLIVSPDAKTRGTLRTTLAGAGFIPEVALGGNTALEHLTLEPTDLVLLAADLPDVTLEQMLARIHSLREGIPVVLLASATELDAALEALRAGVADCLRTPIASPVQAAHRVARVLKERRRAHLAEHLMTQLYRLMRAAAASAGLPLAEQAHALYDALAQRPVSSQFQTIGDDDILPDDEGIDYLRDHQNLPDTTVLEFIDELLFRGDPLYKPGSGPDTGQRLTPRVETSLFVRYGATGTEHVSLGYAHDLSLGGMFILSADPPELHTDLQLEIHVPAAGGLQRIQVQGRVVWVTEFDMEKPHGDGFGVQFTVVDREASRAILAAVTND